MSENKQGFIKNVFSVLTDDEIDFINKKYGNFELTIKQRDIVKVSPWFLDKIKMNVKVNIFNDIFKLNKDDDKFVMKSIIDGNKSSFNTRIIEIMPDTLKNEVFKRLTKSEVDLTDELLQKINANPYVFKDLIECQNLYNKFKNQQKIEKEVEEEDEDEYEDEDEDE